MGTILEALVWTDSAPWIWNTLDLGLATIAGLLALAPLVKTKSPRGRSRWQSAWLFGLFLLLTLFACRLPIFFKPVYINIDEAMLIAQALTYEHYPVPWLDVDPTTNGPLNGYALLWSVPFGIQPCYATARITALLCDFGLLFFLYLAGRQIVGEVLARISILPTFVFFSFAHYADHTCYNNEQVSLVLMGAALYLLTRLRRRLDYLPLLISFGLVIGLLPWAKLQSSVACLTLGIIAAAFLIVRLKAPLGVRLTRCGILFLSALPPTLLILLIVACAGSLVDFWNSYFEMARSYGIRFKTVPDDIFNKLGVIFIILDPRWDMSAPLYLLFGFSGIVGTGLFVKTLKTSSIALDWYLSGTFLTAAMLAAILSTNLPYVHYQLYLLPALGLLTPCCFRILNWNLRRSRPRRSRQALVYAALAGGAVTIAMISYLVFLTSTSGNPEAPPAYLLAELFGYRCFPLIVLIFCLAAGAFLPPHLLGQFFGKRAVILSWLSFFVAPVILTGLIRSQYHGGISYYLSMSDRPMVQMIRLYRQPGARLAIWGWDPDFAAEAGMPFGTRDSHTQWAIEPNPLLDYFRQRYLHDMETIRPTLFLEAIGPDCFRYKNRKTFGVECFPELSSYIDNRYWLAAEIDGMRLFVRNDIPPPKQPTPPTSATPARSAGGAP